MREREREEGGEGEGGSCIQLVSHSKGARREREGERRSSHHLMSTSPSQPAATFEENEKVLAHHQGLIYEAKVIQIIIIFEYFCCFCDIRIVLLPPNKYYKSI